MQAEAPHADRVLFLVATPRGARWRGGIVVGTHRGDDGRERASVRDDDGRVFLAVDVATGLRVPSTQ